MTLLIRQKLYDAFAFPLAVRGHRPVLHVVAPKHQNQSNCVYLYTNMDWKYMLLYYAVLFPFNFLQSSSLWSIVDTK